MTADIDTVKTATNRPVTVVTGLKSDYAGTSDHFVTDQDADTTPTKYITLSATGFNVNAIKKFRLEQVQYKLDDANGKKFQLHLFQDTQADNWTSHGHIVFETPDSQADAARYIWGPNGSTENGTLTAGSTLPSIVELVTPGRLYYNIDWGAAPGSTKGYIRVKGTLLK